MTQCNICFSYQRRKQQGKIPYVKSSELSDSERKKQREKWKAASSDYRNRKKMANAVLDFTPPSIENTPPVLTDVAVAPEPSENADQPMNEDFNPPVASTPESVGRRSSTVQKQCKRLQKVKFKLQKQVVYLKKKLVEMRNLTDRYQKRESRKQMAKPSQHPSEKYKQRGNKKLSAERKQSVVNFLSRDENSTLLAGKKDTITKNKQKMQRRVLTKPLSELYKQYQMEMEQQFSMSYRQFVRPFHITEPKSRDRDTCVCVAHENMRLLVQKLAIKGLLETTSISELLSMIVCDCKKKVCMDRMCLQRCSDEVELPEIVCCSLLGAMGTGHI